MAIFKNHQLDHVFYALGDSTRRHMLSMLAGAKELSASELAEPFDISQPSVSRHLKVLEEAGLVERRIDGRIHQFRLCAPNLAEAEDWLRRHTRFWAGSLKRLSKYAESHQEKD